MNILITGANGFIGKHLIRDLLKTEHANVIGVSRSLPAFNDKKYSHVRADITDPSWVGKIKSHIDLVLHLAQSKEYRSFPEKARKIYSVNVAATSSLLDWCRRNNVSKFIFTSSGNVYKQLKRRLTEDDICEPDSYYGATKLCSELLIKQYKKNFDVVILRLFGVYGKDQKDMLIPNIIQSIRNHGEIRLTGGKGLYITPLFIEDCVSMIKAAMFQKKNKHLIYNIAGKESISLKRIVDLASRRLKKRPIINKVQGSIRYFIGSSRLFIADFNYEKPFKPFAEGLETVC